MYNGGRRSTLLGNSVLLSCDAVNFSMAPAKRLFSGTQFYCQMSCDVEVGNETVSCWDKNSCYITKYVGVPNFQCSTAHLNSPALVW